MRPGPPFSTRFPYTTLFRSTVQGLSPEGWAQVAARAAERWGADRIVAEANQGGALVTSVLDRKSTRLNSSHLVISYAVFCLKKKSKRQARYSAAVSYSRTPQ